jgi:hypothetical protein
LMSVDCFPYWSYLIFSIRGNKSTMFLFEENTLP